MEIKEKLLDLVNSNYRVPQVFYGLENLIITMLEDYAKQQGKKFLVSNQDRRILYDGMFEDGIDDIDKKIAVEIKIFRRPSILLNRLYDTVGRYSMRGSDFDTLLLIIVNDIPASILSRIEKEKENIKFDLQIWDINKLEDIFKQNEDLFNDLYSNLDKNLLKNTVNQALKTSSDDVLRKKEEHLKKLKIEYDKDNIVLFLGAGASYDAKIATWDTLITDLLIELIDKELAENDIQMENQYKKIIATELSKQNGASPLLQTRFIRTGMPENFGELVRKILYKNSLNSSDLLNQIGQLCIPNRGKVGVQAIVNYNFDDLIEKSLDRLDIRYRSIYDEGMIPNSSELGIYHVHGFLPQETGDYDNLENTLLVFSEEGYHKLVLESYNWANITQINFLTTHTCVFIGLSLTDPNLRRLLEIVAQKNINNDDQPKHYAVLKRSTFKNYQDIESIRSFEKVNQSLQEVYYQELGLNIIWVDDFKEIPNILKSIKG
ncbi:SIR2 family protein [Streptococcus gordonii]|uniref:SIR2 family protein n=1 Tax=Streptococcus gordonii TaxID=1302 RepID=UPI001D082B22|nr:SIR2 family protein [Streptococcus gordonii]MCB6584891.1 SIR2 family protein [Streptococcus gordonii]MCB7054034.1 SIR2 family protein [Streptococcus gordonii]MCB7056121.1 SIR2 family protein [Streptococcus gordonii]MCG4843069.1 SIR2 family protein [Streptococcus gordonii]